MLSIFGYFSSAKHPTIVRLESGVGVLGNSRPFSPPLPSKLIPCEVTSDSFLVRAYIPNLPGTRSRPLTYPIHPY